MNKLIIIICISINFHTIGQDTLVVTIDNNCKCPRTAESEIDGSFELYASIREHRHSSNVKDTLIYRLDYTRKQMKLLPESSDRIQDYRLVFTPSDTLIERSEHYFGYFGSKLHLNCFFFNMGYPSFLKQIKKRTLYLYTLDTLV
jgi:hypothetical protein